MANTITFEVKINGADGAELRQLTIEAGNVDEALQRIQDSAQSAGDKLKTMAEKSIVLATATSAARQLAEVVESLAAPYESFEQAMARTNTMALKNADDLELLTNQVQDLAEVIPLAREELAEGLYQAISAGVPEDNWIDYVGRSARSAVGGMADLGGTVKVTSAIIKAYGLEWDAAGAIQDKIQMTAKNGVTSFEELSQALPRVTGNAATLGVTVDELMAVFATTTNVTGNTAEVSTQLAAVLNALVKPTTEATKAAQAMGIRFDAAGVKAAGGLQNFLLGLDSAVQEYAAKTGTLSETIYGELFGSAEALRLLGALTGEQRDRFAENISAMNDSAGSIDQAFEIMSSTSQAQRQLNENQRRSWLDLAGSIAATAAPYVEFGANMTASVSGIAQLTGTTKLLVTGLAQSKIATIAMSAAAKTVTIATAAWQAAQTVLNAVLTANPIGIVIMAVAALVAGIVYAYNHCEQFRRICDQLWDAVKEIATAIWDWLVKAFEDVSNAVQTAYKWCKEFFGIDSSDVEAETEAIEANGDALETDARARAAAALEALKLKEATDWQTMSYKQLGEAIEAQKVKVQQLAGVNATAAASEAALLRQMQARYKTLGQQYGLAESSGKQFDGKSLIANAASYKELGNNIQYYQTKLERLKPSQTDEIERLSRLIVNLKKAQEAITDLQEAASRPEALISLDDFDKEISYLEKLRGKADGDKIAELDARIAALRAERQTLEDSTFVALPVESIRTYQQLSDQLSHYQALMQRATEDQRPAIQAHISQLEKLSKTWDDTLEAMRTPEGIDSLGTVSELETAIQYYQTRLNKATKDEYQGIQDTLTALQRKRDMLTDLADLAGLQAQSSYLAGLDGKELKMRLKLIGADEVQRTLATLRAQLNNPTLGSEDRKALEAMIQQWRSYNATLSGTQPIVGAVEQSMGGITSMLGAISGATSDSTAKMIQWGAQVLDACTKAFAAIMAVTAAEAAKSAASMPIVGWVMAGAAIASTLAAFASIPKFANGGIAYGPTLGIFGEYAGAANNPEVVAPLDRLKALIAPDRGDDSPRNQKIRLRGRTIEMALTREQKYRSRS